MLQRRFRIAAEFLFTTELLMASLQRNASDYNYRRVFDMNTLQYSTKQAFVPTACEGGSRIRFHFCPDLY